MVWFTPNLNRNQITVNSLIYSLGLKLENPDPNFNFFVCFIVVVVFLQFRVKLTEP